MVGLNQKEYSILLIYINGTILLLTHCISNLTSHLVQYFTVHYPLDTEISHPCDTSYGVLIPIQTELSITFGHNVHKVLLLDIHINPHIIHNLRITMHIGNEY